MSRPPPALLLTALLAAGPAAAGGYTVLLGQQPLGRIEASGAGIDMRLQGTPFGAFDGSFTARLAQENGPAGAGLRYTAHTDSAREKRDVSLLTVGGEVVEARVEPASEATALSQPGAAPAGAIDPVRALAHLAGAGGCPAAFRLYDGRRVAVLAPESSESDGAVLTCRMRYQVTEGPGHAGPLRLRGARVELVYPLGGGAMSEARIKAGPITLRLAADG
ncbi:hypothetical protein GI374_15125 [Paracoccus sp. S-4012]|uniref:hypothetical protein n=1 Tax=Paracoccus sp. S-4012 TaxID=2665648 RepID=UPI0012AFF22C|nr:hypothetical protein [Paracoccus sp. S-4012]MRX51735.1 hypothetical protein [Paracoccus sp. S-4012]